MGNYGDILAQLKIYQRLLEYIDRNLKYSDLPTKYDKGVCPRMIRGTDSFLIMKTYDAVCLKFLLKQIVDSRY